MCPAQLLNMKMTRLKTDGGIDELTNLKQLVTQVVLLKTGIFALPMKFVEKQ